MFHAWTNPDDILKWVGPGGIELDLVGVFSEIAPPSRLAYTWQFSVGPPPDSRRHSSRWSSSDSTWYYLSGYTEKCLIMESRQGPDLVHPRRGILFFTAKNSPESAAMPVDVITEIAIARPRETVARFGADPDNAPAWYVNIKAVEWETPRPLDVGSRIAFVAQFLGRRLAYTYEVIEFIPNERLVMRTSEGPFPMETTYTWSSDQAGNTRMTLRNRGDPAGFSRVLAPFMAFAMRRANGKDLKRLKQLIESR